MKYLIHAQTRHAGRADRLRQEGFLPGVVYGPDMNALSLTLDARVFERLHREAGTSTLIECRIEGREQPETVLIQDVQYDPLHRRPIHVDLRQINMNEEITTMIPLLFVGEAPAVREGGGTLVTSLDELEVKCLPKDLVNHIEVDLSALKTFHDSIHVKNLSVPAGITILNVPEMNVANVMAPLTEEQLKAMEEEGPKSVEEVEVAAKKKEEGEEDATGVEEGAEKKGATKKEE